jgi:hypothetical protein
LNRRICAIFAQLSKNIDQIAFRHPCPIIKVCSERSNLADKLVVIVDVNSTLCLFRLAAEFLNSGFLFVDDDDDPRQLESPSS